MEILFIILAVIAILTSVFAVAVMFLLYSYAISFSKIDINAIDIPCAICGDNEEWCKHAT